MPVRMHNTTDATDGCGSANGALEISTLADRKLGKFNLESTSNVFDTIRPYFLVQWGTARVGCRPSPQDLLQLECQGGELEVIQSDLECQHESPDRVICSLPHSTLDTSSGAEWTQGSLIASCHKGDNADIPEAFRNIPLEFRASFDMTFPSTCVGVVEGQHEEEEEAMPFGGVGIYLSSSRMCSKSTEEVELLPSPRCTTGEEIQVKASSSYQVAAICQADDSCRVPACPAYFQCAGGHTCEVKPRSLMVIHDGFLSCDEYGLEELVVTDELWEVTDSHVLSAQDLEDAGVGVRY